MKLFISFISLTIMAVLLASAVSACSCAPQVSIQQALEDSESVFVGKVTSVERESSSLRNKVTFKAQRIFKGIEPATFTLYTGTDSAGCGYGFEVNKTYLVYANQVGGEYTTSICTRTSLIEDAQEDLDELGYYNVDPTPIEPKANVFTRMWRWFTNIFR